MNRMTLRASARRISTDDSFRGKQLDLEDSATRFSAATTRFDLVAQIVATAVHCRVLQDSDLSLFVDATKLLRLLSMRSMFVHQCHSSCSSRAGRGARMDTH